MGMGRRVSNAGLDAVVRTPIANGRMEFGGAIAQGWADDLDLERVGVPPDLPPAGGEDSQRGHGGRPTSSATPTIPRPTWHRHADVAYEERPAPAVAGHGRWCNLVRPEARSDDN